MTSSSLAIEPVRSALWPLSEMFRREPLYATAALVLAALILPTLVAMSVDQRTFNGVNVWIKPLKFEISLAIYLATLAWFAGWLPAGTTGTLAYRTFAASVVAGIAAEMVWVGGAAAFGIASHFNVDQPFMKAVYGLMGVLAVLLTSSALVYGVLILTDRHSRLEPAFQLAVGIGLVLTFVLTVVVAGYMASRTGHSVGGNTSDAGLIAMGWSRTGGDLRVAHFFATHAMHIIPAFGFLAGLILAPAHGRFAVFLFSSLFTAFVVHAFVEAIRGRPFLAGWM
jgi:hypothetical protein